MQTSKQVCYRWGSAAGRPPPGIPARRPRLVLDAGFFEGIENYDYRPRKVDQGFSGTLSSRRVKTNTMTFSYDVNFAAMAK